MMEDLLYAFSDYFLEQGKPHTKLFTREFMNNIIQNFLNESISQTEMFVPETELIEKEPEI